MFAERRQRFLDAMGRDAVVDTAAVIAMFHLNDRIADATGAPIDEFGLEVRMKFGEKLGMSPPV